VVLVFQSCSAVPLLTTDVAKESLIPQGLFSLVTSVFNSFSEVRRCMIGILILSGPQAVNYYRIFLPELSFPLTMTQMVGYYQDPEGKTIFSRTDPSKLARNTNTSDLQSPQRKQTQELESGVSVTVNMGVTLLQLKSSLQQSCGEVMQPQPHMINKWHNHQLCGISVSLFRDCCCFRA